MRVTGRASGGGLGPERTEAVWMLNRRRKGEAGAEVGDVVATVGRKTPVAEGHCEGRIRVSVVRKCLFWDPDGIYALNCEVLDKENIGVVWAAEQRGAHRDGSQFELCEAATWR